MIRKINKNDKQQFLDMANIFYKSDAVSGYISDKAINDTFHNIANDSPFIKGFMIEIDNQVAGFFTISFAFQTQYGKPVLLFEDLYIKDEYQGKGIGSEIFKYIEEEYSHGIASIRLEVESSNHRAISLYERLGYSRSTYYHMIKEF